jgi:hypothetical protein
MANINKNLDLMDDPDEIFRKSKGSVKTVLKPRNTEEESKDFFKAQLDMTKDFLPKETMAKKGTVVDNNVLRLDLFSQQIHKNDDFSSNADLKDGKMMTDPVTAYNAVYPSGNPIPASPNTKPTSSVADDHKGGYRGDESVPQNYIGSIQLEYKSGAAVPIGDNYLPDGAWNSKDKVKPPITQQSSSSEYCIAENPITINVGSLIEQALKKDIEDVSIKVKF